MIQSLHFIIDGEFLTDLIRSKVLAQNLTVAYEIISEIKPIPTNEQIKKILSGDMTFKGCTVCDNPECEQCKGKTCIILVEQEDIKYKKELQQHKQILKEVFVEIDGDTAVEKTIVSDIVQAASTLNRIKEIRKNEVFTNNLTLKRKQTDAADDLERAEQRMYQKFYVEKDRDYPIGSRNWKQKLRLDGVMEIIKAKSMSEKDVRELLDSANLAGKKEASFDKIMSSWNDRE